MSSPVPALIKSTHTSSRSGRSRSPVDTDGEAFQVELGKASKRAKQPERADEPKTSKASRSRKPDAKGESRPADSEEPLAEPTDAAAVASAGQPVDEAAPVGDAAGVELPETAEPTTATAEKPEPSVSPLLAMATSAAADPAHAVEDATATPVAPVQAITPTQVTPVGEAAPQTQPAATAQQGVAVPADEVPAEAASAEPSPIAPQARPEPRKPAEAPVATEDAAVQAVTPEEKPTEAKAAVTSDRPTLETPQASPKPTAEPLVAMKPPAAERPPEVRFAQDNHESIVRSVRTELLPRGGTMQIRLDPPELGALHVILSIKDGVATASFQTSNEQATQLLSHSLSHLKTAMESTGITVDKLQVTQAPRSQDSSPRDDSQQRGQPGGDEMARQQEQQRKEMLRRMWRRVSVGSDPLDLVA